MARNFFDNLPSTRTPLTAPRLNGLLDGDEPMGNVVVDSIRSKNMFNKYDVIEAYLNTDGTTSNNPDHRVSGYIDIDGISNLTISGNTGAGIVECFYDSSKSFISAEVLNNEATKTISVPSNAKYIRVTIRATQLDVYQLEKGSTATSYAPYQNTNGAIIESDYDDLQYCYYVKFSDGTLIKYGYYTIGAISGGSGYTHYVSNMRIPFINSEYVVFTTKRMGGTANFSNLVDSTNITSSSSFEILTWCNSGNFDGGINAYVCIGRWRG